MKLWTYVITLLAGLTVLFSQEYSTKSLIDNGFENVYTETKDGFFILIYENRIYRSELTAMETALDILQQSEGMNKNIRFIPLNRGVPMVSVNYKKNIDSWDLAEASVSPEYLSNSPENTSFSFFPVNENWRENSSFSKWAST